eukprot:scaffold28368_cov63-Phaeocystis_antarctica.AAC.2
MESVHDARRIRDARIALNKRGDGASVVDKMHDVSIPKDVGKRVVARGCSQQLQLSYVLLLLHEEPYGALVRKDGRVDQSPAP